MDIERSIPTVWPMKKPVFLAGLFLLASVSLSAQHLSQDPNSVRDLEALERQVTQALAQRDRAALEAVLAPGFTFIHASGQLDSRQQYLDLAASGGLTRQQVEVERINEPFRLYGAMTAIRISRAVFRFQAEGRASRLRNTVVYVKSAAGWQLATSQSTRLPDRPHAVSLDKRSYSSLVGRYAISPTRQLTIWQAGDTLLGAVPQRPVFELIPQSATEFARYSEQGGYDGQDTLVFVKDATGGVTQAALRFDGQELWRAKRIK